MSVLDCRVCRNLTSCRFPQILRRILGAPCTWQQEGLVDRLLVGRLGLDLYERSQLAVTAS